MKLHRIWLDTDLGINVTSKTAGFKCDNRWYRMEVIYSISSNKTLQVGTHEARGWGTAAKKKRKKKNACRAGIFSDGNILDLFHLTRGDCSKTNQYCLSWKAIFVFVCWNRVFFTESLTISVFDPGNQNTYFKPNHDPFLMLTKRKFCINLTENVTKEKYNTT